ASGSRASAGSRTSSRVIPPVDEARSDSLCRISRALTPGVSIGTTNPAIPSSGTRAQITATSATGALVIHIFEPVRIQSPPGVRVARLAMDAGSEPWSGSVRPKQPIASPAAIRGSQARFCSSDPYRQIAYIASDPCTDTSDRAAESPASSSRQATPYATAPAPAQP